MFFNYFFRRRRKILMPQEWTADVVARMHMAKITMKRLAAEHHDVIANRYED